MGFIVRILFFLVLRGRVREDRNSGSNRRSRPCNSTRRKCWRTDRAGGNNSDGQRREGNAANERNPA